MNQIVILDFGGQYAHLIATRIRSLGVYTEIRAPEGFDPRQEPRVAGVILSGGPHSVAEQDHPTIDFDPAAAGVPILGLCYGHQLLAQRLGGLVEAGGTREFGSATVRCEESSPLFANLGEAMRVWMSHGDHVSKLPPGCRIIASTEDLPVAAFETSDQRMFGLQFHPEVTHTEKGMEILDRFLSLCVSERPWNAGLYHRTIVDSIRTTANGKELFLFLSGGVDSLVTLELCLEAVGPTRVRSVHVDTGLMREGESSEVVAHLAKLGYDRIDVVHAEEAFLSSLSGVHDPEEKRRIIGKRFVTIIQQELARMPGQIDWLLVQGTIYPDRIESGATSKSARIKTHHNRVAEIERLIEQGRVLEPLKDLYKDEVRLLGRELGLPPALLDRHPFPGPGLGVRILASPVDRPEDGYDREIGKLRELLGRQGLDGAILPVRSVGVQGDSRSYLHPVAVWTRDGTFPGWDVLLTVARQVVNDLSTVNRVVYSRGPLKNIALVREDVNRDRADRLRRIDAIARERTDHLTEIWQMPVISLPARVNQDNAKCPLYVVRPIVSRDAMTADVFRMPENDLAVLLDAMEAVSGRGTILYDVTSKPPATIEWE